MNTATRASVVSVLQVPLFVAAWYSLGAWRARLDDRRSGRFRHFGARPSPSKAPIAGDAPREEANP
jgi:hypothetical protein